jgi:hypothetical protein
MTDKNHTSMSAEFFVLSMLHRKEINAYLTLGKTKAVDILIEKGDGTSITIDVKGIAGTTSWPVDNVTKIEKNHYLVFVSFMNKIRAPSILPEVYIVPSLNLKDYIYTNPKGNRKVVNLSELRKHKDLYLNKWEFFE